MSLKPHCLVTGGAGFIGSHLVERLLTEGNAVTIIDDCSTGSLKNLQSVIHHSDLKILQSKVSECSTIDELAEKSSAIYHLAAAVGVELVVHSPIRTIETNLHETEVLLRAAGKYGTSLLLTSTSEVYGKSLKPEFKETDDLIIGPPHLGRWSYACSKLMDEFLALAYAAEKALPVVIARLFNTVGPRQTGRYGMVLPRFIAAAKAGEPIKVYGDGNQTRCFCYVTDTVEALVRLHGSEAARNQVFNIGSTQEISIRDLAELVIKTLNSRSQIEFIPYADAYAPGFQDMLRRKPCIDKLFQTVSYKPSVPLERIIELTAGTL